MEEEVDKASRTYWGDKSEEARGALYDLATNSTVLSEEKRAEIAQIIMKYPKLELSSNADAIFDPSALMKGFKLWSIVIVESNRLSLSKIARTYDEEISRAFGDIRQLVRDKHELSFKNWLEELLTEITDNITDYNPSLHIQAEIIRKDTERINELVAKLNTLERCTEQVKQMIDWKE